MEIFGPKISENLRRKFSLADWPNISTVADDDVLPAAHDHVEAPLPDFIDQPGVADFAVGPYDIPTDDATFANSLRRKQFSEVMIRQGRLAGLFHAQKD